MKKLMILIAQSKLSSVSLRSIFTVLILFSRFIDCEEQHYFSEQLDNSFNNESLKQKLPAKYNTEIRHQGKYVLQWNTSRKLVGRGGCVDNPFFSDFLGLSCFRHLRTYDCKLLNTIGYPASKVQDVLANCPKSCNICEHARGSTSAASLPTLPPTIIMPQTFRPTSAVCADNPEYKDKIGFRCTQHAKTIDCRKVAKVGYSKIEVQTLLKSCPKSCGVCGMWDPSIVPSIMPSAFPSSGKFPSEGPSSFPSEIPSAALSSIPSIVPSTYPTLSLSPTTGHPTYSPTMECHDYPNFKDYLGLSCVHHRNRVCGKTNHLGYPPVNVWELMMKCPYSCGFCETGAPSEVPSNIPTKGKTDVPSMFPSRVHTSIPSRMPSFLPTPVPSVHPTIPPTGICHDNRNYRDRLLLPCSYHQSTSIGDCASLTILGYSNDDVKNLIKNCPFTCGYCDSSSPSSKPSTVPTNLPTHYPTTMPTYKPTSSCYDNASFVDVRGLACTNHKVILCQKLTFLGYSFQAMTTIMSNCPKSCRLCSDTEPPIEAPLRTANPTTFLPTPSPTLSCSDDLSYKDQNNFSCLRFTNFNCEVLHVVGYSMTQVAELISHCPRACGYC